jgi:hypothetical protein
MRTVHLSQRGQFCSGIRGWLIGIVTLGWHSDLRVFRMMIERSEDGGLPPLKKIREGI